MKNHFPTRRVFLKSLGAGLLIAVAESNVLAQQAPPRQGGGRPGGRGGGRGGRGGGGAVNVAARVHIGQDGTITVMTGKVECGQGARAEITQAAAEELRVPIEKIQLVMGDTSLCPDDGGTYGSQTTPRTIPSVRQGAAGARQALIALACQQWGVFAGEVQARDGKIIDTAGRRELTYGQIVRADSAQAFAATRPSGVTVTAVDDWKIMGTPTLRTDARAMVDGSHQYPSDIVRPGMLYGRVLRPPSYGATLTTIDLAPAQAIRDVVVVHDGDFVGVAARTSFIAAAAIDALAKTAVWESKPQISTRQLYDHLRESARDVPDKNPFEDDLNKAAHAVRQVYHVAYAQHAPMEPRAAVAEWQGDHLTVWTATQNPWGVRGELQRDFGLSADAVRVIVPDFGGAFGGKHTGESAHQAAQLARVAQRPVWIRWKRQEEFTWAYFRPAGVIITEAGLDAAGAISSWYFVNINSGPSGVETPYQVGSNRTLVASSDPPLRQGSYRGLAGTANHFARESFMDELAHAAGADPLAFRMAHLQDPRLIAVLQTAAQKFDWANRRKNKEPGIGVGLACGMEKGSYVAACAQVAIDAAAGVISVRHVCQTFECGKIINPAGLLSQVQGAIVMGLGPALREEIQFENGRVTNGSFSDYLVPRFADLPELDVHLLDRPDLPPAGAGETPIMAIAPAIANAVFHATGKRIRQMPLIMDKG